MPLNFNDALAEADIEAACRRLDLTNMTTHLVLAGHRASGSRLLAASVLTFAMTDRDADPDRGRRAAECGADFYLGFVAASPPGGYPVPDDSHDWHASVIRACNPTLGRPGLSPEDRSYVLGRFVAEGWRAVAAWAELSFHPAGPDDPDVSPAIAVRAGCRQYVRSRLWLRDHRPEGLPLSIYAAAG